MPPRLGTKIVPMGARCATWPRPAGEVKRGVRVRAYQERFGDHTMSR